MTVLFALLAFGTALFVLWPLFMGSRTYRARRSQRDELLERRSVLLRELRDLELEFEAGKMDASTYHDVRSRLEGELAEVLAALETLGER